MEQPPVILVVDDEEAMRDSCRQTLERSGYKVETARDGYEGLRSVQHKKLDLILLDLKMPGLDGTEFLSRVRSERPELDVIVITGYSSVNSAVDCMRLGAYDYLPKPFEAESLRLAVGRAVEKRKLALENQALRRRLREETPPDILQGRSDAICRVQEVIRRVAPTESTVLILGESGTGKELVARAIHRSSPRGQRPIVTVDCGALVETLCESELFGHVKGAFTGAVAARPGRFEMANGGTIFLDEIGNIGPAMQGKLLRVLQEKEITRVGGGDSIRIDVRVIAATNQDLRAAMYAGRFREDLFYRLGVVLIEIPPLRARREDVPLLADELLHRLSSRKQLPLKRLAPETLRMIQIHSWPGNVRELENTLERSLVLAQGQEIMPEDLHFTDRRGGISLPEGPPAQAAEAGGGGGPRPAPAEAGGDVPSANGCDLSLSVAEARHIRLVLDRTGWQFGRAAGLLGIDRKTLWRKVRDYRLR
jgi:DNA-binding NtrC family response regulator